MDLANAFDEFPLATREIVIDKISLLVVVIRSVSVHLDEIPAFMFLSL